jgi:hypothetical protein
MEVLISGELLAEDHEYDEDFEASAVAKYIDSVLVSEDED